MRGLSLRTIHNPLRVLPSLESPASSNSVRYTVVREQFWLVEGDISRSPGLARRLRVELRLVDLEA